jgi:hypothetical protein
MTGTERTTRDNHEGDIKTMDTQSRYDDRYVWIALAAIGVLTPILFAIVLMITSGTGILLDLWLAFGTANLLVWPVVLIAGLVDSARRAVRTAKVVKRSIDRKLELRREAVEPTADVEAIAA